MKFKKRREIANRFIQTVLWIDDQIIASKDPTGDKFRDFFQPACEEFARHGFLCHLKGFMPDAAVFDPYVDSMDLAVCKELVKRADVVIIDWHLGIDSPDQAIEVIKSITGSKGTKFCVVLSQALDLQVDFERALPDISNRVGRFLTSGDGSKFFLLLNKGDFESNTSSCQELIRQIVDAISGSYQDYLHWIAIEIMANIRDAIPTLLANLPKDTDQALMADSVIDRLEDTLGFAVASIGEDLYDIVTEMQLSTVATCQAQFESDTTFATLKQHLPDQHKDKKRSELADLIKAKNSDFAKLFPSYKNLTRLLEQKSLDQVTGQRVYQGAIYKKSSDLDKIWICISQACDCNYKPEVLMLRARLDDDFATTTPGRTFVAVNDQNYVVLPNASSCVLHKVSEPKGSRSGIEGLQYCGGLRSSVAMRIGDRFFSHLTRIGVNQPSIIRELRGNS